MLTEIENLYRLKDFELEEREVLKTGFSFNKTKVALISKDESDRYLEIHDFLTKEKLAVEIPPGDYSFNWLKNDILFVACNKSHTVSLNGNTYKFLTVNTNTLEVKGVTAPIESINRTSRWIIVAREDKKYIGVVNLANNSAERMLFISFYNTANNVNYVHHTVAPVNLLPYNIEYDSSVERFNFEMDLCWSGYKNIINLYVKPRGDVIPLRNMYMVEMYLKTNELRMKRVLTSNQDLEIKIACPIDETMSATRDSSKFFFLSRGLNSVATLHYLDTYSNIVKTIGVLDDAVDSFYTDIVMDITASGEILFIKDKTPLGDNTVTLVDVRTNTIRKYNEEKILDQQENFERRPLEVLAGNSITVERIAVEHRDSLKPIMWMTQPTAVEEPTVFLFKKNYPWMLTFYIILEPGQHTTIDWGDGEEVTYSYEDFQENLANNRNGAVNLTNVVGNTRALVGRPNNAIACNVTSTMLNIEQGADFEVKVKGYFGTYVSHSGDVGLRNNFIDVLSWGNTKITSLDGFIGEYNAVREDLTAIDKPNFQLGATLRYIFGGSTDKIKTGLAHWDVSNVVSMYRMMPHVSHYLESLASWRPINLIDVSFFVHSNFNYLNANPDVFKDWDMPKLRLAVNAMNQVEDPSRLLMNVPEFPNCIFTVNNSPSDEIANPGPTLDNYPVNLHEFFTHPHSHNFTYFDLPETW